MCLTPCSVLFQGYRTGYTYRYPFVQEKSKPKSDVLIPATVTAFVFEEEPAGTPALHQHAQKQQKEKTRWLNTPNTYTRVNLAEEPQGSTGGQRTKTTVRGIWGRWAWRSTTREVEGVLGTDPAENWGAGRPRDH